jgi:hypothetical protein
MVVIHVGIVRARYNSDYNVDSAVDGRGYM